MSLSRAQVQFIANTEPYRTALIKIINELPPLLWSYKLAVQRRRSRLVTRNKQRRNW